MFETLLKTIGIELSLIECPECRRLMAETLTQHFAEVISAGQAMARKRGAMTHCAQHVRLQ
jgi:hypothetical protein